jgi:hypothetical protein
VGVARLVCATTEAEEGRKELEGKVETFSLESSAGGVVVVGICL